jgi:transposase-like protein
MTRRTGRPPTDPAKLAAALQDVANGLGVTEAARAHGVAKTVLYEARKAADAAARPGPAPSPAPPVVHRDVKPDNVAPRPAGGTAAEDLELVDSEIEATRAQLRERRANGDTHGMAALQKNLLDLIRRRRELRPPPPPDPDDEERRWRGDADSVIAKIEAGVKDAERRREGATEGKAA